MSAYQSLENLLFVQTQKLQDLETTTELIHSKSFVQDEIITVYNEVCSIEEGIEDLKEEIKEMKIDNEKCRELFNILQSLDQQIHHMENNVPSKIQEYMNSQLPEKTQKSKATSDFVNNTLNNVTISNGDTSKMHITDGMKNCKKILFNEPEIPCMASITEDEFSKIPKYIIGRYSLEVLNNLVSNINQIIKAKYSIIALGKNGARKRGELDLYLYYMKEQTNLGPDEENTYFFTSEDYEKYIKAKLDKTKLNLLIALRHCKKLREIRTAKHVHYALIMSTV